MIQLIFLSPALRSCAFISLLVLFSFLSSAQSGNTVNGKIKDPGGEPIAGATVSVKGTSIATSSDANGNFSITLPGKSKSLVISYVGMEEKQVIISSQAPLDVSLNFASAALQDVVVVGYGTQKKSDVTGALGRISADEIQERPAQNVLQAVQGKAAGVQVSSNIKPGELPVIRIRGNRSLGAFNDPLYVVDGIAIVNALGLNSFSISDLNPSDIASMEILKDASATKLLVTENHFAPGTPEALAEGYIPTVTSKDQMFIHFIYNEKAREFLSEGIAWEDLHNAGILYERVTYLNQMASDKTGLWPVAFNTENGNGQNGNGKGQMQKYHTFRPWPNLYLVQLTDETGKLLDAPTSKGYQNPGY